uniref:ATP synthase F(0) complex subunit e, mitochondrial n=1 Tax=Pygocentrus nattereri TaxID=42514 RepID=A0A3B4C4P1_PYGNA
MAEPCVICTLLVSQTARYSALIAGIIYGKKRYDYLKPIAEEERRIEEEEKKVREEKERIAKQLAEGKRSR